MSIFTQYSGQSPVQAYYQIKQIVKSSVPDPLAPQPLSRQITAHRLGDETANEANEIVQTFTRYVCLKHQKQEITAEEMRGLLDALKAGTKDIKQQEPVEIKSVIMVALIAAEKKFETEHHHREDRSHKLD